MLLSRKTPLATRPSRTWRLGTLAAMSAAVTLATAALGVRPVAGQTTPKTDVPPAPQAETPMPPKPVDPNVPKAKEPTPPPAIPGAGGPTAPGGPPPGQPHTGGLKPAASPGPGGSTTPGSGDSVIPGVGSPTPPGTSAAPAPGPTPGPAAGSPGGARRFTGPRATRFDGQAIDGGPGGLPRPGTPAVGAPPTAVPGTGSPDTSPGTPGGLTPPAAEPSIEKRGLDAELEKLRAERANLQAELKSLRDRLERSGYAAGIQGATDLFKFKIEGDPILAANKTDNIATLNRVDAEGRMRTEAWTLDKEGQPSKLLSSTVTGETLPKPHSMTVEDGKIRKLFKQANGTTLVLIYEITDGKEGKVIGADTQPSADSKTKATPTTPRVGGSAGGARGINGGYDRRTATPPPVLTDPSVSTPNPGDGSGPVTTPRTVPTPRAVPSIGGGTRATAGGSAYGEMGSGLLGGGGGLQRGGGGSMAGMASMPGLGGGDSSGGGYAGLLKLDLVTLATNYADAVAAVEYAKAALDHYQEQGDKVSGGELAIAKVRVSGAARKEQLLRQIIEVSYAAAKTEAKRTSELVKSGLIPLHEAPDSEARMLILEQILKTK